MDMIFCLLTFPVKIYNVDSHYSVLFNNSYDYDHDHSYNKFELRAVMHTNLYMEKLASEDIIDI